MAVVIAMTDSDLPRDSKRSSHFFFNTCRSRRLSSHPPAWCSPQWQRHARPVGVPPYQTRSLLRSRWADGTVDGLATLIGPQGIVGIGNVDGLAVDECVLGFEFAVPAPSGR